MTLTWQTLLGGDLAPILTIFLCAALAAGLVRWGGRSDPPTPPERTASPKQIPGTSEAGEAGPDALLRQDAADSD